MERDIGSLRASLNRLPLHRAAVIVLLIVVASVVVQLSLSSVRRSDVGAELLLWTTGLGEIALGLILLLAMIRRNKGQKRAPLA